MFSRHLLRLNHGCSLFLVELLGIDREIGLRDLQLGLVVGRILGHLGGHLLHPEAQITLVPGRAALRFSQRCLQHSIGTRIGLSLLLGLLGLLREHLGDVLNDRHRALEHLH